MMTPPPTRIVGIEPGASYAANVAFGTPGQSNFGFTTHAIAVPVTFPTPRLLSVCVAGVAKAMSGGAFAYGAMLGLDAAGCVIAFSGVGIPAGRSLAASAGAGNVVDVFVNSGRIFG